MQRQLIYRLLRHYLPVKLTLKKMKNTKMSFKTIVAIEMDQFQLSLALTHLSFKRECLAIM